MSAPALGALALALNAEAGAASRQWVELIPAGPDVVGRDGRRWTMPDAHAVVSATRAENKPLAVDWEHASIVRADAGLDAPASGWIEGLEVRAGSIWGEIAWTPRARDQVANREYRFISPVFAFDGLTKQIKRLTGAGLTNNPNLELTAMAKATGWKLVKEASTPAPRTYPEEVTKVARALGYTEDQIMPSGDH